MAAVHASSYARSSGQCFVPELLLGVIKLVAGVDGVADARERGKRIDVHRQLLLGEEGLARGGIVRRGLQPVGQRLQLLLQLVDQGRAYGISENFMEISLH